MESSPLKDSKRRAGDSRQDSGSVSAVQEPGDATRTSHQKQKEYFEPPPVDERLLRATQFYWKEMVEIRAQYAYHCLHRDEQAKWGIRLNFIKAIATSSTIAGWAIWQNYAIIWGAIIAASQFIDALKDVFPHAKARKSSADLANSLDILFSDARVEFEKILFGGVTAEDAGVNLRKLQKLRHDAETKFFPEGIIKNAAMESKANQQTKVFFKQVYGSDEKGES